MKTKFYLVIALQVLILLGIAGLHSYTLATGRVVLLKTVPVDPRSLFQGQYVDLSYEISTLDLYKLKAPVELWKCRYGQTVYVVLQNDGKYWRPIAVDSKWPPHSDKQVVIRGKVDYPSDDNLFVRYGLETFFVPESIGPELERAGGTQGSLDVEASIGSRGNALIKRVLLNNKPVSLKPK